MGLVVKLVRHGESDANTGRVLTHEAGDHAVPLSELGKEQARRAGELLGEDFVRRSLVYCSPYRRTRETLAMICQGAGVQLPSHRNGVYEDPRLREVEHGYEPAEPQQELRRTHGWFYYRYRGGESPADCYDRTSSFLESMMRQVERKQAERVLIVTHGLTIRCFVMRFLHLSVEEFDALGTLPNCAIVTLAEASSMADVQLHSGRWGVTGLVMRPASTSQGEAG